MDTEFVNWLAAQPFYALMVGLFSGALGILFGHWLSLGRDKRKEFNELAQRLRSSIDKPITRGTYGTAHFSPSGLVVGARQLSAGANATIRS